MINVYNRSISVMHIDGNILDPATFWEAMTVCATLSQNLRRHWR